MQSAFVVLLRGLIDRQFNGVDRQFIIATKPPSVPAATAYFSQVMRIAKPKPPPLESLPAWADALGLEEEARQEFMDLAAIAHLPAAVQTRFVLLLRHVKKLEAAADVQKAETAFLKGRLSAFEAQRDRVPKHE